MNNGARSTCLIAALVAVGVALAERPGWRQDAYARGGPSRDSAGVFDYYVLSLSWSPTYCAGREGPRDPQCRAGGRPFAFVLHGLWPQFERGWPRNCQSPDRGFVPWSVAQRMGDIMPNPRVVFHEYRTHGTCSGLGVEGYFALARRLYEKVRIPSRFLALSDDRLTLSPSELIDEFLAANPSLAPQMIAVACAGSGNRLREVRICFDRSGNFRACGENENQRKLCAAERMYVPPLRPGP